MVREIMEISLYAEDRGGMALDFSDVKPVNRVFLKEKALYYSI